MSWDFKPSPPAFVFSQRAGLLNTELSLQVRVDRELLWRAFIDNVTTTLYVRSTHRDTVTTLRITGDTLAAQTAFKWFRDTLRVVVDSLQQLPARPFELVYWELGPVNSEVDSMRWTKRREWRFWVALVAFVVATLGAVIVPSPPQPKTAPVPRGAISLQEALSVTISRVTIEVKRTSESPELDQVATDQARDLLWEILVGLRPTDQAVRKVLPRLSPARRYQLLRRASLQCVTQIEQFLFQLEGLSEDLNEKAQQLRSIQTSAS